MKKPITYNDIERSSNPELSTKIYPAVDINKWLYDYAMRKLMPLEPVGSNILVKRLLPQDKIGGIHIPEQAQDKPIYGRIVAVSGMIDYNHHPDDKIFTKGMKVLFGKYSGLDIEHEGEKFLLLKEEEILAIVRD